MARSGWHASAWDIRFGNHQDVLSPNVYHKLCGLLRSRGIHFLWMGVPCETWSRARRPGRGPPPLRSD
eukprot:11126471-Lingulodinium_polyedra.AAC.1